MHPVPAPTLPRSTLLRRGVARRTAGRRVPGARRHRRGRGRRRRPRRRAGRARPASRNRFHARRASATTPSTAASPNALPPVSRIALAPGPALRRLQEVGAERARGAASHLARCDAALRKQADRAACPPVPVRPVPDLERLGEGTASSLAGRAVRRAAPADAGFGDRRAAPQAGLALSTVDLELVLHRAATAVRRPVVARASPPGGGCRHEARAGRQRGRRRSPRRRARRPGAAGCTRAYQSASSA